MTTCEDCDEEIEMTDVQGHYSGRCANCDDSPPFHSRELWRGRDEDFDKNNEGAN